MPARAWTRLWILAVALALAFAAPLAVGQPGRLHRIVAIGDLHGDFAAWRTVAAAAGLIDRRGRWAGGDTVLVQVGDVVDRGPDSRRIIQDLMRLQREALRRRGRVIALVGNHEAMNLTGDLRYVPASDYAAFVDKKSARRREEAYERNRAALEVEYRAQNPDATPEAIKAAVIGATPLGMIERQAAWAPNGAIGRWVVGNPAVVLLDGTLFVHGGLCGRYASMPVAEINREVAAALAVRATLLESIINDETGPLWCRHLAATEGGAGPGYQIDQSEAPAAQAGASEAPPSTASAQPAPPLSVAEQLDQLLALQGAKRIVIGHTPILSGIAVLHGGRLVRIDTGISAVYGGKLTYLEILDGNLVPHVVDRPPPGQ